METGKYGIDSIKKIAFRYPKKEKAVQRLAEMGEFTVEAITGQRSFDNKEQTIDDGNER